MRIFLGFVIVAAIVGGFLSHRKQEPPVAPAPVAVVMKAQATPARQTSEHNWPKYSLDRAAEVKREVLEQRKENGDY